MKTSYGLNKLLFANGIFALFFLFVEKVERHFDTQHIETSITFSYTKTSCNQFDFVTTNPTTYSLVSWDFGDGNTSASFTPTHFYGTTGTYTVCLDGVNGGTVETDCQTIVVEDCCIDQTTAISDSSNGACCFDLVIDNSVDQMFTGLELSTSGPSFFTSSLQFNNSNWGPPSGPTGTTISLNYVGGNHIPLGNLLVCTFCMDDQTSPSQIIQIDWMVGPDSICTTIDSVECTLCKPNGPNFSVNINPKVDPTNANNTYDEFGQSMIVDKSTDEIIVAGTTPFINEIGDNNNFSFCKFDNCAIPQDMVLSGWEPLASGAHTIENVQLLDTRAIAALSGAQYVSVQTIQKGNNKDIVISYQDANGFEIRTEDIFNDPNLRESLGEAFIDGTDLIVVGWQMPLVGFPRKPIAAKIDLLLGTITHKVNYDVSTNNIVEAYTGIEYNNEYYISGYMTNSSNTSGNLFVMKLDQSLNYSSISSFDVDNNVNTVEIPRKMLVDQNGDLIILGDHESNGGLFSIKKLFFLKISNTLGDCSSNIVLNAKIIDLGGGDEILKDGIIVQGEEVAITGLTHLETFTDLAIRGTSRPFLLKLDDAAEIEWLNYYDADGVEDLEATDMGYALVGSKWTSSLLIPGTPPFGFDSFKRLSDTWLVKTDDKGSLSDCDCFFQETFTETILTPLESCPPVIENAISTTFATFNDYSSVALSPTRDSCGVICGTGTPGIPCPTGCCSNISGVKFEDHDNDGIKDPFEPGICNWQVTLTGPIPSTNTVTTTTNAAGFYAFNNLCPGEYIVSETQETCWTQTFPATSGTHSVLLNTSTSIYDLDFGNHAQINCGVDLNAALLNFPTDTCKWSILYDEALCSAFDLKRIEVYSNTPGVDFKNIQVGVGLSLDPFHPATNNFVSIWNNQTTPMPGGFQRNLMMFQLDNYCDPLQTTQELIVKYFIELPCSFEVEFCTDTLYTTCELCPAVSDCTIDSLNVSTAHNPYNGGNYPVGGGDLMWQMTGVPPGTIWTVPRNSFVINEDPGWDWNGVIDNNTWLSGQPNSSFANNNQPPCTEIPYLFERCFCLEEADSIQFKLEMAADDFGRLSVCDSTGTTINTIYSHDCSGWTLGGTPTHQQNFGRPDTIDVKLWLPAGKNCLKMEVWNTNGEAMGFNVKGHIFGNHIVADTCCAVKAGITGTKFFDKNCNGERDLIGNNLEQGACNFGIVLCDTFNNPIDTVITDNRGVYSFNCIPTGCYRVKEIQKPGWTQTLPTSSYYQVCLDTFDIGSNLDFGNCLQVCDSLKAFEGTPSNTDCCKWVSFDNLQSSFDLKHIRVRSLDLAQSIDAASIITTGNLTANNIAANRFEIDYLNRTSPIPSGSYNDGFYFCLDPVFNTPQTVVIDQWIDIDDTCIFTACTDTLVFECYPPPPGTPCDSVFTSSIPTPDTTDNCCHVLNLNNQMLDYFIGVEIKTIGNGDLIPVETNVLNSTQWSMITNSTSKISLLSNTGSICPGTFDRFIPLGNFSPVSFCMDNFVTNPQVQVDWIGCDGEICSDTLTFECSRCIEVVNDTLYCVGNSVKYDFDFKNLWDMKISRLVVDYMSPSGATITPDTLNISPSVCIDSISGTHTLCLDSLGNATEFKVAFKALDSLDCCFCISDTLCYDIPICCDTCESIEYLVTDTICGSNECCFTLDFNHCIDSFFTGIELKALGSPFFGQQKASRSWYFVSPTNKEATWHPRPTPPHSTFIPRGWNRNDITFCFGGDDPSSINPKEVEINWFAGPNNIVCSDTLEFECLPRDTCALVDTFRVNCDTVNNIVSYDIDLDVKVLANYTVEQIDIRNLHSIPSGAVFNPSPVSLVGNWNNCDIITMPTLNVSGVAPGDSICFYMSLYDTLGVFNSCCHTDTICIEIPPCPSTGNELVCDSLDWSGFDITLDTSCLPGFYPDVNMVPVIGGFAPDWIDYDIGCDNVPELREGGPVFFGLNFPNTGPNYIGCATFFKVINGDTCDHTIRRELLLELCPPPVGELTCDSLDWSGFDIALDTICMPGAIPDVSITPVLGSFVPDWIEYDNFCDNTIDFTETGPTFNGVTWPNLNLNFLACVTFYEVVNGDTCDFTITRDLTLELCPPPVGGLTCDSLDWSGFDIVLDTICMPGAIPDVSITPVLGSFVPDWIEYDNFCDNTIDFTETGPTFNGVTWPNLNLNFLACVTFYEVVNGDTCDFTITRDLTLEFCPPVSCCQDSIDFSNAVQTGFTYQVSGQVLTIDNLLLDSCDVVTIDWDDGNSETVAGNALPVSHTYPVSPNPNNYFICLDVTQTDLDGTLCWTDMICENVLISPVQTCCLDSLDFVNAVDNGFTFNKIGLMVTVDNPLITSCMTLQVDWGDGNNNALQMTDLPFTHTYTLDMDYQICVLVTEEDLGQPCWEREYCETIISDINCDACSGVLNWNSISSSFGYFDLQYFQGYMYVIETSSASRWDGTSWTPVNPSFTATFEQFFVHQNKLWAIMSFTSGGTSTFDLAIWNEVSFDWDLQNLAIDDLNNSLPGQLSIAMSYNNNIVLGGTFNQIASPGSATLLAENIVVWDNTLNTWSALSTGLNGIVRSLIEYNGDLIAGGGFDLPFQQIARWDGTNWQGLNDGLDFTGIPAHQRGVRSLYEWNGDLYVGGRFPAAFNAGFSPVNGTNGLAIWDGTNWSSLGGGITSTFNFQSINSFKAFNNELYLVGQFSAIGGQNISGFAKWDGVLFQNAGLSVAFEGFDLETFKDGLSNECELWLGGEQILGKLTCDPVSVVNAPYKSQINIFPNPTKDELLLQTEDEKLIQKYWIYDSIGELILNSPSELECNYCNVDVNKLIAGIYFIKIEVQGEGSKVYKFVKE